MISSHSSAKNSFPWFPRWEKSSVSPALLLPGNSIHPNTCWKQNSPGRKKKQKNKSSPCSKNLQRDFRREFGEMKMLNQKLWTKTVEVKVPRREQNWACTYGEKGCFCCVWKGRRPVNNLKAPSFFLSIKSIKEKYVESQGSYLAVAPRTEDTREASASERKSGSLNCCLFTMDFLGSWSLSRWHQQHSYVGFPLPCPEES